jgi:hypothetical protein
MNEETADRQPQRPASQRFKSSAWQRALVLILLILLALGVLVTLVVIGLSVLGLTPGA